MLCGVWYTLKYLGFSLTVIKRIIRNTDFEVLQAINSRSTSRIINILEMNTMSDEVRENFMMSENQSELGKRSDYDPSYNPDRLYPIAREGKRNEIGIDANDLPFVGFDVWNHYEVSWLNSKGKPIVATAEIIYDCHSPFIIESKSMKLYFNSFNNTQFESVAKLKSCIKQDIEKRIESTVSVKVTPLSYDESLPSVKSFEGININDLDVECSVYTVEPGFLKMLDDSVEETLVCDLLKSNCLVTGQPDWGSLQISYIGNKICHEGLLKYIVSFRNHNEFHEQCIERIFVDILNHCQPKELTVYGRYTRRGGLDINPYRSTNNHSVDSKNVRLLRQ